MKKEKIVMLMITEECNLSCYYCFEHHKAPNKMSFDMVKSIIDYEISLGDEYDSILIEFFGGEPFIEFDLIKKTVEYVRRKDDSIKFFITTNGTVVHGEIQEWLKDNSAYVTCCLSLDGTPEMHNINRCNSFDEIDYHFFRNTWPHQTCKMTISDLTLPYLFDGILYLTGLGFKIKSSFAQGIEWHIAENTKTLEKELNKLADYYINNTDLPLCDIIDFKLGLILSGRNQDKRWCGAGKNIVAYDCNGHFYPCQAFAPVSIGDGASEFVNTRAEKFDGFQDPLCADCIIDQICPTCYGANNQRCGDYRVRDQSLCKIYKLCIMASAYVQYMRMRSKMQSGILSESEILLLASIKATNEKLTI